MGVPVVSKAMKKVFGTRNERLVKNFLRIVDQVSAHEDEILALSDAELRAKTVEFRDRVKKGESAGDMVPEIFAVAREAMDRAVGVRSIFNPENNFDPSQLPAGLQSVYADVKAKMAAAAPLVPPTMMSAPQELQDAVARGETPIDPAVLGSQEIIPGWQHVDIPNELYEAVREMHPVSKPPYRSRPFDVQIIGAVVLSEGKIAEMKTGEGKTIVAPLASYLAAIEGRQIHVVTVNDYLVQRDRDWVFPFFRAVGLTVGAIHPMHEQPPPIKKMMYQCDVVYGTTAEFGFDYLRDNMKLSVADQVQKRREFAIVDEVDSILIDEARTPLIISGAAHQHAPRYDLADKLARDLVEKQKRWNEADEKVQSCLLRISGLEGDIRTARDKGDVPRMKTELEAAKAQLPELEESRDHDTQYYEVELDKKKATLTHEGIEEAQRIAGVGSFYVGDNIDIPHLLEQSIRAHTVYMRDRDYVVAPDDRGTQGVVIVDQNTGRKMVGRQWSDGLHQAVEAKEGVPIKEETQTMATITIQNFFKLYDRISGMTGTADTEATEFHEIYSLDVVVIPTNVPVERDDYDDLVFMNERDKWDAIVDEIKRFHDIGRPILVGTTSVEKSETLSEMLSKRFQIKHEVLNAKQHEREADIVASAGDLGSVTIATNMAGRGTDIKLQPFDDAQLVDHWKRRGLAGRDVKPDLEDEKLVTAVYRHMATKELELPKDQVASMSDEEVRESLLRHWAVEFAMLSEKKAASMTASALYEALEDSGNSVRHRLRRFVNSEELGGLHVIGTERHESRRIDNQLRGRSGRQGDKGSSRFFLSLDDDLMKMFAGETTRKVLSRLGMKEGDAIEHPMLSKSVGKAERKVEERNFLIRKNILEYDEVMDHQRHAFYGMRQEILEGRGIKELIFGHIEESVQDAAYTYLSPDYVANCIGEWVRENLNVSIDPERIKGKDHDDLAHLVRVDAKEDAASLIRITMGEYMPEDSERADWDYKSFVDWANANFDAGVRVSEIQDLSRRDIFVRVEAAADRCLDAADLAALDQFLIKFYGEREFSKWANNKFGIEFEAEEFANLETPEPAAERVMERAREVYSKRETSYGVEFALDMTNATMKEDPQRALSQFCGWAHTRFELDWEPTALPSSDPRELYRLLLEEREKWDESRIAERAERAVAAGSSPEAIEQWCIENLSAAMTDAERERAADDPQMMMEDKLAGLLRAELTQFERWVLLQIIDQAWKDHLYAVDQLKEAIGFRSFSQRDPRIEFKKEGARLFDEMHESIRDKVTDLIFKAKLTPQAARPQATPAPAPAPAAAQSPAAQAVQAAAAAASVTPRPAQPSTAAVHATEAQRRDIEAADQAGVPAGQQARRTPVRASSPPIGRNEVVTVLDPTSGEKRTVKYKKAQPLLKDGWRLVKG